MKMEIKSTMNISKIVRAQSLYRPTVWDTMDNMTLSCNAYRYKDNAPEHCDCHNCVSYALDIMEAIQMEIALGVKHA
tara:strand:- start:462 stop:692 length:231 start_codon:yes stop_codon:yes gene_type:complete